MSLKNSSRNSNMPIKISKRYPKKSTCKPRTSSDTLNTLEVEAIKSLQYGNVAPFYSPEDKENRLGNAANEISRRQTGSFISLSRVVALEYNELPIIAEQNLPESTEFSAIDTPLSRSSFNDAASLSEHGFSALSTPVGDDLGVAQGEGVHSRPRPLKQFSSSSGRKVRQADSLDVEDDYATHIRNAAESYANDMSFDVSFDDSSSNRVSAHRPHPHPSVDEAEDDFAQGVISYYDQLGGGSKSVASWGRQRSTRISALLTSGNSTDRSSSYSWGEDEFDKHATKCVAAMFEEIDQVLYEDVHSRNAVLNRECKEWSHEFPYIRVLGSSMRGSQCSDPISSFNSVSPPPLETSTTPSASQTSGFHSQTTPAHVTSLSKGSSSLTTLTPSSDLYHQLNQHQPGYPDLSDAPVARNTPAKRSSVPQLQHRRSSDSLTEDLSSSFSNEYSICGSAMAIRRVPSPVVSFDSYGLDTELGSLDMYIEETFEQDGEIEEVFAYDNQELSTEANEQENKFHVPRKKKRGYPPVTPFACTRDNTFGNVLLDFWPQMMQLVSVYLRKRLVNISQVLDESSDVCQSESQLSPQSKELAMSHQHRLSLVSSNLASISQVRLNTANSQMVELNEVLSIAPKKIGRRNETALFSEDLAQQTGTNSSSNLNYSNAKNQQPNLMANGVALTSNATKNRYPSAKTRLQPIAMTRNKQKGSVIAVNYSSVSSSVHQSPGTIPHNPMVVRKLFPETQLPAERIMTPPISLGGGGYRYNQLPPIDPIQEPDPGGQHQATQKGVKSGGNSKSQNARVFSARTDEVGVKKAVRTFALHKENFFIDYSRPSTTAEIRDETPGSPLGNSKWHPYASHHQQSPAQISPLATSLLKARNSQDYFSGLVGNGIVGVSMNLNYREDSSLSDETLAHYGAGTGTGMTHLNAGNSSSQQSYHAQSSHVHSVFAAPLPNHASGEYHWDQHHPNGSHSRPSSRHPRNSKLGTAR